MDSFNQITGFRYNPNTNTMNDAEGEVEFSGILEIYVHHARNIHNICIYDNQDVYAKFSLTYNPDETISTQIINGGGKNPQFNENLTMKITQPDAILKCEIWMLSRARNFMEDQLLGFALVPIFPILKGKITEDFSLSSTDLFHSPAGTVRLTLSLDATAKYLSDSAANSSITSEVVLLDRKISEVIVDPVEYSRIEFPDINIVKENQQMVSDYFNLNNPRPDLRGSASFLHLGASHQLDDYEMNLNSSEENQGESISPRGSIQNSGFLSSTITSLSDDRNSDESADRKGRLAAESSSSLSAEATHSSGALPDTPTSRKGFEDQKQKQPSFEGKEENTKEGEMGISKFSKVFSAPTANVNSAAEESKMQQQIVDMYMRSMHQFTESLAKMKLPMDLDKVEIETKTEKEEKKKKKKDGSRVFYGSRAFF